MALDPQTVAALALHRFGLGPRAEAIAKIASDPRGALLAELDRPGAGTIDDPNLLTSAEAAQAGRDFRQVRKAARLAEHRERQDIQLASQQAAQQARNTPQAGPDMNPGADMKSGSEMKPAAPAAARDPSPGIPQQIFLEEAKARLSAAAGAETGFAERLVWFWSNHLCLSAAQGSRVLQLAGAYEREAIRSHLLGRFAHMLLALETHPPILLYLDNARSTRPNSPAGRAGRH